jgi:RimJ/RimL family protein N-acetyltransferase
MRDDLEELRRQARSLLDIAAPRDALAVYYALHHDPARTQLFIEGSADRPEALLSVCQTGWDLFQPIVSLRALNLDAAEAVLKRGLQPNRPYYLTTTPELHRPAEAAMKVEQVTVSRIYLLDMSLYSPDINVLVMPLKSEDGATRFVIRSGGEVAAESGVNWQSPHFAELYAWTAPMARGRGWGKAVVETCVAWLMRSGVQPIYIVSEDNDRSIRLAESVGFVDTGAREFGLKGIALDTGADGP